MNRRFPGKHRQECDQRYLLHARVTKNGERTRSMWRREEEYLLVWPRTMSSCPTKLIRKFRLKWWRAVRSANKKRTFDWWDVLSIPIDGDRARLINMHGERRYTRLRLPSLKHLSPDWLKRATYRYAPTLDQVAIFYRPNVEANFTSVGFFFFSLRLVVRFENFRNFRIIDISIPIRERRRSVRSEFFSSPKGEKNFSYYRSASNVIIFSIQFNFVQTFFGEESWKEEEKKS